MMDLLTKDSPKLALEFLVADLGIPEEDQDYFTVLSARPIGSNWDVIEIGIEGLPDKWVLQVFDTGECDPCYTFNSPMPASEDTDLEEFPLSIAEVVATERQGGRL